MSLTGAFAGIVVIRAIWLVPSLAAATAVAAASASRSPLSQSPPALRRGRVIAAALSAAAAAFVAVSSSSSDSPPLWSRLAWPAAAVASVAESLALALASRRGGGAASAAAAAARIILGAALLQNAAARALAGCLIDAATRATLVFSAAAVLAGLLAVAASWWRVGSAAAAASSPPPAWRAGATSPPRSIVTVSELDSLFVLGSSRQLAMGDLQALPADVGTARWAAAGSAALCGGAAAASSPSLLLACWRLFGLPWAYLGAVQAASVALSFAGPLLLNRALSYLEGSGGGGGGGSGDSPWLGLLWATLLVAAAGASALLSVHYNVRGLRIATALRAALVAAVFRRSLSAPPGQAVQGGAVTNFLSADVQRLADAVMSSHQLWALPLQVAVTLYLLYTQVAGAFAAGLAVILLLVPLNVYISRRIGALTADMMSARDDRVRRAAELLHGVRAAKALAWDAPLMRRVQAARDVEFAALAARKYLDAACVYLWASTPVLVALATFATVVLAGTGGGGALSASSVFTTVALLSMLIFPLNSYSWIITGILEARVSLARLDGFLFWSGRRDPLPLPCPLPPEPPSAAPRVLIALAGRHAFFPRTDAAAAALGADAAGKGSGGGDELDTPLLKSLDAPAGGGIAAAFCLDLRPPFANDGGGGGGGGFRAAAAAAAASWGAAGFAIREGALVAVTGGVGAGKSALFAAILGQLDELRGDGESIVVGAAPRLALSAAASLSYAPQSPWVFAASIRDNVTLGEAWNAERYDAVLDACCLREDVATLAGGDAGGEVSAAVLSGGQAARLSLARALYSRSAILLADDPTASLDAVVALRIWREAFASFHAARGGGGGGGGGGGSALLHAGRKAILVATHDARFIAGCDAVVELAGGRIVYAGPPRSAPDASAIALHSAKALAAPRVPASGDVPDDAALPPVPPAVLIATSAGAGGDGASDTSSGSVEARANGAIRSAITVRYLRAAGAWLSFTVVVSLAAAQLTRNGSDWWLSVWSAASSGGGGGGGANAALVARLLALGWGDRQFLLIFAAAALANTLATAVRAASFAAAGLRAARSIHDALLRAAVFAPLAFHDAVPVGRLMNRLSADQFSTDESLPFSLNILLAQLAGLAGTLIVLAFATSGVFLAALPALGVLYWRLQAVYRAASREVKRLDSVARSPLFAHFADAAAGARVLTAHSINRGGGEDSGAVPARAIDRSAAEATARLDASQTTAWTSALASQWLSLRLQAIGAVVLALVAYTAAAVRIFTDTAAALPLDCAAGDGRFGGSVAAAAGADASTGASTATAAAAAGGLAGVAGFALAYAIPVVGALQGLIGALTETEKELVAVERAVEYCSVEPEEAPRRIDAPATRGVRLKQPPSPAAVAAVAEGRINNLSESLLGGDGDGNDDGVDVERGGGAVAPAAALLPPAGAGVALSFSALTVRYPGTLRPALAGLSLHLPAGARLGVGGRTGSGKSTLLAAVLRLVPLEGGSVALGGVDAATLPLPALRGLVCGVLPQTPFLIAGTVRENLDVEAAAGAAEVAEPAAAGARDAELEAALARCGLPRLPLDASVEAGGVNLSLGERQLLALARLLARRPRPQLLLVDEAASAADAASAARIAEVLRDDFAGVTQLIVAHRPQSLLGCNVVLMLREGLLAELGTPEELLRRRGGALAAALAAADERVG